MDKEYKKEYDKKRYLDNKQKLIEKQRQYRINNKEIHIKYYLDNKDKIKQYRLDNKERWKEYYLDNQEKYKEKAKQYYLDNKERRKQYNLDNKEKIKQYYLNNIERRKQYRLDNKEIKNERDIERKKIDPLYKLSCNLRTRICIALKSKSWNKRNTTNEILGCDFETVKKHLENQFIDNMSWDNHGKWHIDHIKPLAKAETEEELYKRCHYTNLQPLWAVDNLSKGAKEL